MSVKAFIFSLGCVIAWFVLMPLLVIGGGLGLFAYALIAEMRVVLLGSHEKSVDSTTARAMAHRMCLGSRTAR